MALTISTPWLRLHLAVSEAMLAAERAALMRLRAILARVTLDHARAVRNPAARTALLVAARDLETAIEAEHLRARATARAAGHETLLDEWALARLQGLARGLPTLAASPVLEPATDEDRMRARAAAASFARDWLVAAQAALDDGAPAPLRTAAARMERRLELQATTETSESFSAEREAETTRLARSDEARQWAPLLLKVWDARLDRACPICRGLDGQVRPWGIAFEGGRRPGGVHPGCRCNEMTIFAPITWRAEERAAA
jgi:hypothetical protein